MKKGGRVSGNRLSGCGGTPWSKTGRFAVIDCGHSWEIAMKKVSILAASLALVSLMPIDAGAAARKSVGIANPASAHCGAIGGRFAVRKDRATGFAGCPTVAFARSGHCFATTNASGRRRPCTPSD
jgi:putative hemolysin